MLTHSHTGAGHMSLELTSPIAIDSLWAEHKRLSRTKRDNHLLASLFPTTVQFTPAIQSQVQQTLGMLSPQDTDPTRGRGSP